MLKVAAAAPALCGAAGAADDGAGRAAAAAAGAQHDGVGARCRLSTIIRAGEAHRTAAPHTGATSAFCESQLLPKTDPSCRVDWQAGQPLRAWPRLLALVLRCSGDHLLRLMACWPGNQHQCLHTRWRASGSAQLRVARMLSKIWCGAWAAGRGGARAGAQEPGGDQGAAGGALHRLGARLHPGTALVMTSLCI